MLKCSGAAGEGSRTSGAGREKAGVGTGMISSRGGDQNSWQNSC